MTKRPIKAGDRPFDDKKRKKRKTRQTGDQLMRAYFKKALNY